LDEVTKRDERDKGGSFNGTCDKKKEERRERKIQNNLENRELFQIFRVIGFFIFWP
jgi:hypothetical protein